MDGREREVEERSETLVFVLGEEDLLSRKGEEELRSGLEACKGGIGLVGRVRREEGPVGEVKARKVRGHGLDEDGLINVDGLCRF